MSNELRGRLKWAALGLAIAGAVVVSSMAKDRTEQIIVGLAYLAACAVAAIYGELSRNGEE